MTHAVRRSFAAFGMAVALVFVVTATPASAHTGFESSDPSDGASVTEPVEEITLRFTGPAQPSGDGFQVLDPQGVIHEPSSASSPTVRPGY